MRARIVERVRSFVGNGGLNPTSSFHMIGEIFDKVYAEGAPEAQSNVQTMFIPPGGAAVVEFTLDVPGVYTLVVDHALSRALDKGSMGVGLPAAALHTLQATLSCGSGRPQRAM